MFAKWLGPGPAAAGTAVVLAGCCSVAALVVAWRGRVASPDGLEAALLLTSIPLLSPQGWDYVFLLATPAVVFVINYGDELPRPMSS